MSDTTETTIAKRPAEERGVTDMGWLQSRHTFSFGGYQDPEHRGYRSLRVINDDRVAPGMGFGTHPHNSMEILTYVIQGELEHKDSMGNGSIIKAGQLQYMSAGSGVQHSEFNPSQENPVHFLQIWIVPQEKGGQPRYREMDSKALRQTDSLHLLASPDSREHSIGLRQDAELYFGNLGADKEIVAPNSPNYPYAWLQVIRGQILLNGEAYGPGDGCGIEGMMPAIKAASEAEFLLFRLN